MADSDRSADTEGMVTKPSVRVVERVADAEGVDPSALDPPLYDAIDPVALDPPLYDAIDPVALDRLVGGIGDGPASRGRISFQYCGYDLTVDSDGTVDLC